MISQEEACQGYARTSSGTPPDWAVQDEQPDSPGYESNDCHGASQAGVEADSLESGSGEPGDASEG